MWKFKIFEFKIWPDKINIESSRFRGDECKTLREGKTSLLIFTNLGTVNYNIPNTGDKGRCENMEMYSTEKRSVSK